LTSYCMARSTCSAQILPLGEDVSRSFVQPCVTCSPTEQSVVGRKVDALVDGHSLDNEYDEAVETIGRPRTRTCYDELDLETISVQCSNTDSQEELAAGKLSSVRFHPEVNALSPTACGQHKPSNDCKTVCTPKAILKHSGLTPQHVHRDKLLSMDTFTSQDDADGESICLAPSCFGGSLSRSRRRASKRSLDWLVSLCPTTLSWRLRTRA